MDARTGRILWALNPTQRRAMASTTKIMTARIVLRQVHDLDAVVTARSDVTTVDEETIGLHAGDSLTVKQLLEGLLIQSGNDAAVDLADYVGGSQAGFVAMMNAEAQRLGLKDTHYANPDGLDAPGHYTTVVDLTRPRPARDAQPGVRLSREAYVGRDPRPGRPPRQGAHPAFARHAPVLVPVDQRREDGHDRRRRLVRGLLRPPHPRLAVRHGARRARPQERAAEGRRGPLQVRRLALHDVELAAGGRRAGRRAGALQPHAALARS